MRRTLLPVTLKHRPLLQHLNRDELLALVDRFAVEVPDRCSKDGLVDALAAGPWLLATLAADRSCHGLGLSTVADPDAESDRYARQRPPRRAGLRALPACTPS